MNLNLITDRYDGDVLAGRCFSPLGEASQALESLYHETVVPELKPTAHTIQAISHWKPQISWPATNISSSDQLPPTTPAVWLARDKEHRTICVPSAFRFGPVDRSTGTRKLTFDWWIPLATNLALDVHQGG